jgi:phosphopantetheinyl transferase
VTVRHLCSRCGATDHGRPSVVGADGEQLPLDVSFSRTTGFAIAAATSESQVGIDVESIARIERHSVADVLLHHGELATSTREVARLWVAKEALLKATGDGLNLDLREIELEVSGSHAIVKTWPAGRPTPDSTITLFQLSDDVVGALAQLRR